MNGLLSQKETVALNGKHAQWGRTAKNPDCSTGPLAHPFACLLALFSCSLAPPCSLCSRASLHSLVILLAHFLTPALVGKWMIRWLFYLCFFFIPDHSGMCARALNEDVQWWQMRHILPSVRLDIPLLYVMLWMIWTRVFLWGLTYKVTGKLVKTGSEVDDKWEVSF